MIVRSWQGRSTPDKADAYVRHLETAVFPELREIPGHRDAWVLRRDDGDVVEFTVLTRWDSMDAIRQFAGDDAERAVVPPEAQALLTDHDATVVHHEIVLVSRDG